MQFYQLHQDAETSSKLLPDYALKSVNIREGYQILSDCGHALRLAWTEQNKEYNRYHPNTWRYWKNKVSLFNFIDHYIHNMMEYEKRFGSTKTYVTYRIKFNSFISEVLCVLSKMDIDKTEDEHMALYMYYRKRKYLSEIEIKRLENIINEGIV